MRIEQTLGVARGMPSLWRIRYHHIRPDRSSWTADRSTDGGKSWAMNYQQIEALPDWTFARSGSARSGEESVPLGAVRVE